MKLTSSWNFLRLCLIVFTGLLSLFCFIRCDSTEDNSIVLKDPNNRFLQAKSTHQLEDTIGYVFLKGKDLVTSKKLNLILAKSAIGFTISLKIELGKSQEYPIIYHPALKQNEKANELAVFLHLINDSHEVVLSDTKLLHAGSTSFDFQITPTQLKAFRYGNQSIQIQLSSELVTFFGDQSGIYPLQALIQFQFKVPPIYHSTFYFKSLKLNPLSVTDLLGENDQTNRLPETGIYVTCNEQLVTTKHATNSFQLTEKIQADFYHLDPNDPLVIDIIDKDYFLNLDDYINRLELPIKVLNIENFQNFPIKYVDELWVKCKTHGIVNRPR